MAIGQINAGYTGYLDIGGEVTKFSDANIAAKQEVNAPDLVAQSWDRIAWVYGAVDISGSVSGPVTEGFAAGGAGSIWQWATRRTGCGGLDTKEVKIGYFCGSATTGSGNSEVTVPSMYVNSVNFSVAAGDIANFSIDVIGAEASTFGVAQLPVTSGNVEKLITWDAVGLTAANLTTDFVQNFDFTVANNIEVVYAINDSADYFPFDLVPGVRNVSGTITIYNIVNPGGADSYDDFDATTPINELTFSIGPSDFTFKGVYHRVEPTAGVGPIVSSIGFTGVGHQNTLDVP